RYHAPAAKLRAPRRDKRGKSRSASLYFFYQLSVSVARVPPENTIYVRKQNKRLRIQHGRNKPRQLVIVGEHQLGNRNDIIFIYYRHHFMPEQYFKAVFHMQVMQTVAKVFLGDQYL